MRTIVGYQRSPFGECAKNRRIPELDIRRPTFDLSQINKNPIPHSPFFQSILHGLQIHWIFNMVIIVGHFRFFHRFEKWPGGCVRAYIIQHRIQCRAQFVWVNGLVQWPAGTLCPCLWLPSNFTQSGNRFDRNTTDAFLEASQPAVNLLDVLLTL